MSKGTFSHVMVHMMYSCRKWLLYSRQIAKSQISLCIYITVCSKPFLFVDIFYEYCSLSFYRRHHGTCLISEHPDIPFVLYKANNWTIRLNQTALVIMLWLCLNFRYSLGNVFMPLPFEEWWKGHIVLPLSVRPSPSTAGVSNSRLSFSGEASVSFGHISSCL